MGNKAVCIIAVVAAVRLLAPVVLSAQEATPNEKPLPEAPVETEDEAVSTPSQTPAPPIIDVENLPEIKPGPPLTLQEALAAADKRNLTLTAARMEIEKVNAQHNKALALILPMAKAGLQYMYRDHEDSINFSENLPPGMTIPGMDSDIVVMPQQDLKGTVEAGISLINAESWLTIKTAKKGVAVAEASIEKARQQLLLGVAQAYYMSLVAVELIDVQEVQVTSAAHHLKVAKARYDAGTGLRIDVIRAETDMEQARQELLSAHLFHDNARDALGTLTGIGGLPLAAEAPTIPAPMGSDEELIKNALSHRRISE